MGTWSNINFRKSGLMSHGATIRVEKRIGMKWCGIESNKCVRNSKASVYETLSTQNPNKYMNC